MKTKRYEHESNKKVTLIKIVKMLHGHLSIKNYYSMYSQLKVTLKEIKIFEPLYSISPQKNFD